ncbi:hypothetical protein BU15DRAFT_81300 [Melanogaster broomeanus]|nr:hypothetical protein BU15DRAFT_81300 [Melanogaster broomeanus]
MLAPTLTQSLDEVHHLYPVKDVVLVSRLAPHCIDLPPELLTAIFLHTDSRTISRCRSVCRRFKDVVDSSVELQYRVELALDGMIDGPPSLISTGERLARLRSLRRTWSTLSCTSKVTVPMPGACYAYELTRATSRRRGSRLRTIPGRTLVHDDIGVPTRDFAMDPSQDLVVLFKGGDEHGMQLMVVVPGTLELYIRTMSTNQAHPEARMPVLRIPVLFPPRITMWNWKTGNLVVDRTSIRLPPATWDFSFIIQPCDRSSSDELPEPLVHVASLQLPALLPHVRVVNLGTHTAPFLAGCPRDKPFTASNEDRIHVLTVQYVNPSPVDGPRIGQRLCVFVPNRVLEGYVRRHAATGE